MNSVCVTEINHPGQNQLNENPRNAAKHHGDEMRPGGVRQFLSHLFHHEHFDVLAGGDELQTELIEQGRLDGLHLRGRVGAPGPFEEDRVRSSKTGAVHDEGCKQRRGCVAAYCGAAGSVTNLQTSKSAARWEMGWFVNMMLW